MVLVPMSHTKAIEASLYDPSSAVNSLWGHVDYTHMEGWYPNPTVVLPMV